MKSPLFILLFALTFSISAQTNFRDLTFGNGGVVMTPFISDYSFGHSVIQQANGKIVAAGSHGAAFDEYLFVVRYNTDGILDSTFGMSGFLVDSLTTVNTTVAWSLDEQPDGKIVVAGQLDYPSQSDIFILRIDSSGIVDSSFGDNGRVIADNQGGEDQAFSIKIQPDGKIIVAGTTTDTINYFQDILLLRLNADGSPDTTFGNNGMVAADFNSDYDGAITLALQQDGKIVIGGISQDLSSINDALIARFLPNGSPDSSFNSDGYYTFDFEGDDDGIISLAIQSDGKILAGGIAYDANGYENDLLIRLDSSGNPDPSFNSTGIIVKNYPGEDRQVSCVLIQPDGKIMTVGYIGDSDYNILFSRYLIDGSDDLSFGYSGLLGDTISPEDDTPYSAIFQSDQNIVITGTYSVLSQEKFFIARYLSDSLLNNIPPVSIQSFTLFPQPAGDRLFITNCNADVNAEVLSLNGAVVLKGQVIRSSIDISSLSGGMYFLRLTDRRNVSTVLKFLKM